MMREARAKLASSTAAPAIQRGYELAWTTIDDVEPEVVQAVSRRERARGDVLVGFEILRPASGLWGEVGPLAFARTTAEAAHDLLMFSSEKVPLEALATVERVLTRDGERLVVVIEPGELAEIATMAARPALAAKFPGRLERLVEAGRLPRCA